MRIAITGATGFIGNTLLKRHILMGDDIAVITRDKNKISYNYKKIEIFQGDINSANLSAFVKDVDILYHCAAEIKDECKMWQVNYDGTRRLFEASIGNVGRWVQLSSIGVYKSKATEVITEKTPEDPLGLYEISKAASDRLINNLSRGHEIEVVILRPASVYGAEMRNQSLFQMVSAINKGLFFYFGNKKSTVHYIHVNDVVNALLLCGTSSNAVGGIYNISYESTIENLTDSILKEIGKSSSIRTLPLAFVKIIANSFGLIPNFPLSRSRLKSLNSSARYSSSLIAEELGFECKVPLEVGVKEIVEIWQKGT